MSKGQKRTCYFTLVAILAWCLAAGGCGKKAEEPEEAGKWGVPIPLDIKNPQSLQNRITRCGKPPRKPLELAVWQEDENVRDSRLFNLFLDNEIAAAAWDGDGDRYLYEYLREDFENNTDGVRFTTEDLDGNGRDELLMACGWVQAEWGYLYVFEELDGGIREWEPCKMWTPPEYQGNGCFSIGYARRTEVFQYAPDGRVEKILSCGIDYMSSDYYWEYWLWLPDETLLSYKRFCDENGELLELDPESEAWATREKMDAILGAVFNEQGGKYVCIPYKTRYERTETIPLEEILKLPRPIRNQAK